MTIKHFQRHRPTGHRIQNGTGVRDKRFGCRHSTRYRQGWKYLRHHDRAAITYAAAYLDHTIMPAQAT